MIKFVRGDLFDDKAEALVNTVNCVGVMGKGIAYQFKKAYPEMFRDYKARCKRNEIRLGEVTTFREKGRLIVNFPTKGHWRSKSKLSVVRAGLRALRALVEAEHIASVAIPPLGCGNGGLAWRVVRQMIESELAVLANVEIAVYEPADHYQSKVAREPRGIRRYAEFSECGVFRYTLERYWDNTLPRVLFGLLNPSKADATQDDPTNRRGMGFARSWGFGACVFANLFAYQTPDPKEMKGVVDPVGPDNDRHILTQAWLADLIVIAWGTHGAHQGRDQEVLKLLAGFDLHYLTLTKDGHPGHPLYLRKTLVPLPWSDRLVGV